MLGQSPDTDQRLEKLLHQVDEQRKELAQARAKIGQLEDALAAACDYAEVCDHFPGRDLLMKRHGITL